MQSMTGFLLINLYAFFIIIVTTMVFFSKQRMKEIEDELYKKFLITNIAMSFFGLIFGIVVSPLVVHNEVLIVIFNKFYLITLFLWIFILTIYIIYISLKNKDIYPKIVKISKIVAYISLALIVVLPVDVEVSKSGAVASGLSIMFTYLMFSFGFLIQIGCLVGNHKNIKNKKYIPLYVLIVIGGLVVVSMMINPSLNYLINPAFIFVAFIMYHTIENPDAQINAYLLRNKELTEASISEKSNFLFKVSQEMKKPVKDILDNIKKYDQKYTKAEMKLLIDQIENDANNAYFIINDISSVSSMDVKKLRVETNKYKTEKFFKDLEYNIKNKINLSSKDIELNFKVMNGYPDYLYGDNIKLKQVLLSLVSNSIKFTDKGFIDVEIDSIERYDVSRLIFTIKDSGSGMSLGKVNDLLSKDVEVDISKFDKNDDLELKVPIIIKIVKLLGGSISIKSEEGKGTIVVVVFDQKIASNEDKILKGAKRYNLAKSKNKRVLVVDDSSDLDTITNKLSNYKVDVVTTPIGRECLDKIEFGDTYDLIIIKDELKDINAYTVLKELKKNKKFTTPVIIKIDKDKEFIKNHFIEDGFSDCVISETIDSEFDKLLDKYI